MSNDQNLIVIYTAATPQQGHLLKNLLGDRGIRAVVTNDVLSGGAGVDIVGWPTQARVAVAEHDAEEARRFAVEFDKTIANDPELAAEADANVDDGSWPVCPDCGARRTTRCPICETTGTDFPCSDPDYLAASHLPATDESHACNCGSGGCSSGGEQSHFADVPAVDDERTDEAGCEQAEPMRTCTTCDEPFVPEYPRRCEWCGHEFDDGYAVDAGEQQLAEPLTGRAVAVILLLVGLGLGLVAYFQFIL